MTDPHRRVSRVDGFAAVDLRVFTLQDTDLWALIAVVNVHSWMADAGDLVFDFIALKTGWSTDKVGRVVKRAVDLGLISTRKTGRGLAIEKLVGPMSWDEYRNHREAMEAELAGDLATAKSGSRDRKMREQEPQNAVADTAKSDSPNIRENAPERPERKNAAERVRSNPQEEKNPAGQITHKKILESSLGSTFKLIHDRATGMSYRFDDADLAAWPQACDLGLTEDQLVAALNGFFAPDSWHRVTHNVRFKHFIGQAQKYAALSAKAAVATKEQLCAYYYPWDPRHPHFAEGDRSIQQQKQGYEATHGPWKPQPDWTPGATRW